MSDSESFEVARDEAFAGMCKFIAKNRDAIFTTGCDVTGAKLFVDGEIYALSLMRIGPHETPS